MLIVLINWRHVYFFKNKTETLAFSSVSVIIYSLLVMNVSYININQSDTLKYSIKNDIFINCIIWAWIGKREELPLEHSTSSRLSYHGAVQVFELWLPSLQWIGCSFVFQGENNFNNKEIYNICDRLEILVTFI